METQKNILYNVLLAISQMLLPLITFPYLARVLGPTHLGLFNFADSYSRYFALVAALGISVYGVREIAKCQKDPVQLKKTFTEIFLINLIATLLLSLVYVFTIYTVSKLKVEKILFYWSFVFYLLQLFELKWFFTGINRFKFIAIRYFIIRLIFIIAVFVFIKQSNDYIKYMQLQVALSILLAIYNGYYLLKFINFKNISYNELNILQHFKPLLILFFTIFSISIYLHFDTVILAMLSDNESVGYYSSSLKLVKIIIAVLAAITAAMFPKMVEVFHQGNKLEFKNMVQQSYELILSIGIPITLLVYLLAPEIVFILFGAHFERSILPLQITSPLILIVSLSSIFGFQILSVHHKDQSILFSAVMGMIVSLVFSFLLIPTYKEIGASMTILMTEILVLLLFILQSRTFQIIHTSFNFFWQEFLLTLPYFFIAFLGKYFITDQIYVRIFCIILLSFIWFFIVQFKLVKHSALKYQFLLLFNRHIKK